MRAWDQRGFTLLEMLFVIALIGIVAAVAVPTWLSFLEGQRVTAGQNVLYSKLRDAQEQAQSQRISWQFSVRERDGVVEWAVHPTSVSPLLANWEALPENSVQLDSETNFATAGGVYYVRFDEKGNVRYRLGRVTLSSENNARIKRCVIVSTLIGAMRKAKERSEPRDGKLCY